MKLPIHLDIEDDTVWTVYQAELRKVQNDDELRSFVLRWANIYGEGIIREHWLTEDTLANVKAEDIDSKVEGFQINDQSIREAAYYRWVDAGCPTDDGIGHWLQAERDLHEYTNMIYNIVLPCKTAHAMFMAQKFVVTLNCAFIQANGGMGEFEE